MGSYLHGISSSIACSSHALRPSGRLYARAKAGQVDSLMRPLTAHQAQRDGRLAAPAIAAHGDGDLVRVVHPAVSSPPSRGYLSLLLLAVRRGNAVRDSGDRGRSALPLSRRKCRLSRGMRQCDGRNVARDAEGCALLSAVSRGTDGVPGRRTELVSSIHLFVPPFDLSRATPTRRARVAPVRCLRRSRRKDACRCGLRSPNERAVAICK